MNEGLIIKSIAIAFCVFVLTVGGCQMRKNELRFEAIKSGVDPMVLSCANNVGEQEQHICTIIAQRGVGK